MERETRKGRSWLPKAIAGGAIKAAAYHVTIAYVIPLGLPLLAGYLGYVRGYPWMIILVAAGLMFAAIATGLLRFDEWLDRRRVRDKLQFTGVRIGRTINGPEMTLGLNLSNHAGVGMDFEISKVSTRLGDRVPKKTNFDRTRFTIPARGIAWFDDHGIDTNGLPRPGTVEGFLDIHLRYGRIGGSLNHNLHVAKQVNIAFDANGILAETSWHDAPNG